VSDHPITLYQHIATCKHLFENECDQPSKPGRSPPSAGSNLDLRDLVRYLRLSHGRISARCLVARLARQVGGALPPRGFLPGRRDEFGWSAGARGLEADELRGDPVGPGPVGGETKPQATAAARVMHSAVMVSGTHIGGLARWAAPASGRAGRRPRRRSRAILVLDIPGSGGCTGQFPRRSGCGPRSRCDDEATLLPVSTVVLSHSPSQPTPDTSAPYPQRLSSRLLTAAACGGLKPPLHDGLREDCSITSTVQHAKLQSPA
jgi:hypothetical protein